MHKDTLKQKIETFINENNITQLHKDSTELFQKINKHYKNAMK